VALTGIGCHQRRKAVRSRSTRVSSPEITLKWSLKNLFAHFTASRSRSDSSSAVRDLASEVTSNERRSLGHQTASLAKVYSSLSSFPHVRSHGASMPRGLPISSYRPANHSPQGNPPGISFLNVNPLSFGTSPVP
jgi:hypothetical protein